MLPFLGIALTIAVAIGPVLTSGASSSFRSPISPISPLAITAQPVSQTPERERVPPPETGRPTATATVAPTEAATVTVEIVIEEPPEQVPPTPAPIVEEVERVEEPSMPPTLWVLIGLVVVGGIVAGLIVFRRD
jgi:hypothetical protein